MKTAYLIEDTLEKFNTKRSYFVKAWRIVDIDGNDLVQPWMTSKAEAREVAESLSFTLTVILRNGAVFGD